MKNKQKSANENAELETQEDMQFLLSNIRARQNGLIFFLERLTTECRTPDQFLIFKEQFLQKQKIYANQVTRIVNKYASPLKLKNNEQQNRTLWIKVKSIVKVSLDRLRILDLLNQRIFLRYQEIIKIINKNYDEQNGLEVFTQIENLLRKRNGDAIAYGRVHFNLSNSESKLSKNRSQSAFKERVSPKGIETVDQQIKLELDNSKPDKYSRMKSLNKYRKKKMMAEGKNSPSKQTETNIKKISKGIDKINKFLEGVADGYFDISALQKKRTPKQNGDLLYEQLFKRNIPNHKMISKFYFGACGMNDIFSKTKRTKAKPKKFTKIEKQQVNKTKARQNSTQFNLLISHPQKQKEYNRPQSSQTIQLKIPDEDRKNFATNIHKKTTKYVKSKGKMVSKTQKYTKLIKLIS